MQIEFLNNTCWRNIGKSFLLCFSLAMTCEITLANDSSAGLAAGGLVLQKLEDIAMVSEELYISVDKIEVNYIFENRSKKDIMTIVAFPMPPFEFDANGEPFDDQYNRPYIDDKHLDNYLDFHSFVDGKAVATKSTRKVVRDSGDFPSEATLYVTFYWQQTFPAGKKIKVRHSYTPSTTTGIPQSVNWIKENYLNNDTYCPDKNFIAALNKYEKANYDSGYHGIDYILTSGANWAGGVIEDFRLIIDKGKPDAFVTFCGDGVQKISPTQFEMRKKKYVPKKDLSIFILSNFSNPNQ
ncbi:DUF4424 domain-containing protein [Bartonella sp. HY406]|uniref:DUF4424 domain-containing protein n=1 Tax=Bartonella sp. HY406 TaxID=2979331 RepID=UPI0021CAA33B|nr:DUF4424 domain-containing protein [Bartonella sp. HY406]UXN04111.1 DUF4424 domain-containing protein [Bartonella sp. HY406]